MSKKINKNRELLDAINTNTFIVALSTYHTAYNELNKANMHWAGLATRTNTRKSDLEFLNNTIDSVEEALCGSVIDALSYLVLLYETNRLTKSDRYTVEDIFNTICRANYPGRLSRELVANLRNLLLIICIRNIKIKLELDKNIITCISCIKRTTDY